jgi:hypothetical protein
MQSQRGQAHLLAMKLRTLALVALLAQPVVATVAVADPAPARPTKKADTVPLPKDASVPEDAPGGGGAIQMYKVPRGRDAVVAEMRDLFKVGGWILTKDSSSPSGRAIRIELKHDDKIYKVSFTGDTSQTAIIVTLP